MVPHLHLLPMNKYNILTDALPDFVTLYGKKYPIHTDFKNWLRIACILEEEDLNQPKVLAEVLKLCYKDTLPPNHISAMLGVMSFLNRDTDFSVSQDGKKERICSFSKDASIIYSAFYSKYGIDLTNESMHWYKFCALFEALADDNPFKTVLKIRSTDEREIKDAKSRKKLAKLKSKYQIKDKVEIDVGSSIEDLF